MVIESWDPMYKKTQQVTSSASTKTLMYTSQNNLVPQEQVGVMAVPDFNLSIECFEFKITLSNDAHCSYGQAH